MALRWRVAPCLLCIASVVMIARCQGMEGRHTKDSRERRLDVNFQVPSDCTQFSNQFYWTTKDEKPIIVGSSVTFQECMQACESNGCYYFTTSDTEPGHCEQWLTEKDESTLATGKATLEGLFSTYDCGFGGSVVDTPPTLPPTDRPTTSAPTTRAPTTRAPTTRAPTTKAPTTRAPTTKAPTTKAPTTKAPTTKAPTTKAPTTKAPTTKAPTTKAPTTKAPTTKAPATGAPTTFAPTPPPIESPPNRGSGAPSSSTMVPTGSPTTVSGAQAANSVLEDSVVYALAGGGTLLFVLGILVGIFLKRRKNNAEEYKLETPEEEEFDGVLPGREGFSQWNQSGNDRTSPTIPPGLGIEFGHGHHRSGREMNDVSLPQRKETSARHRSPLIPPSGRRVRNKSKPPLPPRSTSPTGNQRNWNNIPPPLPPRELNEDRSNEFIEGDGSIYTPGIFPVLKGGVVPHLDNGGDEEFGRLRNNAYDDRPSF